MQYVETCLNDLAENHEQNLAQPLHPMSLLLVDINMPVTNGMDAVKAIKQRFQTTNEALVKKVENSTI